MTNTKINLTPKPTCIRKRQVPSLLIPLWAPAIDPFLGQEPRPVELHLGSAFRNQVSIASQTNTCNRQYLIAISIGGQYNYPIQPISFTSFLTYIYPICSFGLNSDGDAIQNALTNGRFHLFFDFIVLLKGVRDTCVKFVFLH